MNATNTNIALDNATLAKVAPAALAKRASQRVSQSYGFISTAKMIEALAAAGFVVVSAKSQRAYKGGDNDKYGRHVLRFRQVGKGKQAVGETVPEVLLIGSHNGRTRFTMRAGLFRMVCMNGMTVATHSFGEVSVQHRASMIPDVVKAAGLLIKDAQESSKMVEAMRNTTLTEKQATAFAEKALAIRFRAHKGETSPIPPEAVLTVRRKEDEGLDLWHVFNRVQENLTKGGMEGAAASGRRVTVRPFGSPTRDATVNFDLWQLAIATMGKKAPVLKTALPVAEAKVAEPVAETKPEPKKPAAKKAAKKPAAKKAAKKPAAKKAAKPVAASQTLTEGVAQDMAALGL